MVWKLKVNVGIVTPNPTDVYMNALATTIGAAKEFSDHFAHDIT